jgi:hypothetical protein
LRPDGNRYYIQLRICDVMRTTEEMEEQLREAVAGDDVSWTLLVRSRRTAAERRSAVVTEWQEPMEPEWDEVPEDGDDGGAVTEGAT